MRDGIGYRQSTESSADAEAEALADLAERLRVIRLRWLLPVLTLALSAGLFFILGYLFGMFEFPFFEQTWSTARTTSGAAAATAFLIPFGLVFGPGYALYRFHSDRVKHAWLDEVTRRLGVDRETMELRARIFH